MLKMNILYVTLLLCFVHQVLTSGDFFGDIFFKPTKSTRDETIDDMPSLYDSPSSTGKIVEFVPNDPVVQKRKFVEELNRGNMTKAKWIFDLTTDEMRKSCADYVISLGKDQIVQKTKDLERSDCDIKGWILGIVLMYATSTSLFDAVYADVEQEDDVLARSATQTELICTPGRFSYLLNKINDKSYQRMAVKNGVNLLFEKNKTECFVPVLEAIKEASLAEDLEDIAVKKAFKESFGDRSGNLLIARNILDHRAISPKGHSKVLLRFCREDQPNELFCLLLNLADRKVLMAVKKNIDFYYSTSTFQQVIEDALKNVGGKSRQELGRQERSRVIMEALGGILPTVLGHLIFGYYYDLILLAQPDPALI